MRDKVLNSLTIWTCASCYQCAVRCPQQIHITDVMYLLKRMAIRENVERSEKAQVLSREFVKLVNKDGRNQETWLMTNYIMGTNPFAAFGYAGVGLKLLSHGRLAFKSDRIKGIAGLRKIIAKAQALGGEV
jgi:heterodisulfide reductase subunit C